MVQPQKLPNFSFPLAPQTSDSQPTQSSTQKFAPIACTEFPRHSRHRRSNAMSTRRNGMLIFTATPTSNPSIPPVPKVPENLKDHRESHKALQSQPLSRSLSDVSSCPTLDADEPRTPDSIPDLSEEIDYFNFKSLHSKAIAAKIQRDSAGYDGDESEPSEAQDHGDEEDDDDDEEFWACRGLCAPSSTTLDTYMFSKQRKDSDTTASNELFATNEDPLECYSDYEHWLQSIASRTQIFAEKAQGIASPSFNDYMGILRFPLLA